MEPTISKWATPFLVPIMKVMDGFGRHLSDQYYKAGSSLEVVCEVCALITYIKESFGSLFVLYSIGYLYPNFFSWIPFPFSGTQQILASCWYGNKSKKLSNHVQKMVSGNFYQIRNFVKVHLFKYSHWIFWVHCIQSPCHYSGIFTLDSKGLQWFKYCFRQAPFTVETTPVLYLNSFQLLFEFTLSKV